MLLYTKAIFIAMYPIFIVMCPLNYVEISVVPSLILIFMQNSGESTGVIPRLLCLPAQGSLVILPTISGLPLIAGTDVSNQIARF